MIEIQVDRLVGPTHHFGGLGVGNVASRQHSGEASHPAAAAIQGLDKMRRVADAGAVQIVLPPQSRPDFAFLRSMGFGGDVLSIARRVLEDAPVLFSAACSTSAIWTANAGTVAAAVDRVSDGGGTVRPALVVANLNASLHRSIEPAATLAQLKMALPGVDVLPPIGGGAAMRDEGAANHLRLAARPDRPAIHVFVHGDGPLGTVKHWPRQTLAACRAVARKLRLHPADVFFIPQHPDAIDAGAFHNDVVAASHGNLVLHHEQAFLDAEPIWGAIAERFADIHGVPLRRVIVDEATLSLDEAVATYLFNSQIVVSGEGPPRIFSPIQTRDLAPARRVIDRWVGDGLFAAVTYVELDQSMNAGGGPACLRLRVPVQDSEDRCVHLRWRWTPEFDGQLRALVRRDYPTRLTLSDLADPSMLKQLEGISRNLNDIFGTAVAS